MIWIIEFIDRYVLIFGFVNNYNRLCLMLKYKLNRRIDWKLCRLYKVCKLRMNNLFLLWEIMLEKFECFLIFF